MNGNIDRAFELGDVDLFGEEALATRFRQGAVEDLVARDFDDDDFDPLFGDAMGGGKEPARVKNSASSLV